MIDATDWIRESDVALLLTVPTATLRAWRARGRLPASVWVRWSERTVRYSRSRVLAWAESHLEPLPGAGR